MIQILKKYGTRIIPVVAIIIICIVWWANGAELEDAWLYVFAIAMIIIPTLETYFKKKDRDR